MARDRGPDLLWCVSSRVAFRVTAPKADWPLEAVAPVVTSAESPADMLTQPRGLRRGRWCEALGFVARHARHRWVGRSRRHVRRGLHPVVPADPGERPPRPVGSVCRPCTTARRPAGADACPGRGGDREAALSGAVRPYLDALPPVEVSGEQSPAGRADTSWRRPRARGSWVFGGQPHQALTPAVIHPAARWPSCLMPDERHNAQDQRWGGRLSPVAGEAGRPALRARWQPDRRAAQPSPELRSRRSSCVARRTT